MAHTQNSVQGQEHYKQIREQRAAIRRYIIRHLEQRPRGIVDLAAHHFGIGVQSVYEELRRLVSQGYVYTEGNTSARQNFLTEKGKKLRKQQWLQSRSGKIMSLNESDRPEAEVSQRENDRTAKHAKNAVSEERKDADAKLLNRKPRNYLEAERLAWLKRKQRVR